MLGFNLCFGPVSWYCMKQARNPAADSSGHQKHSDQKKRILLFSKFIQNKHTDLGIATANSCVPFLNSLRHGGPLFNCERTLKNLMSKRRLYHSSRVNLWLTSQRELAFAVNIFDLEFGVQIDSVKQPTPRDSVGFGHVSHHWTSSFRDHLDHCLVFFTNAANCEDVTFVVT